MLWSIPPVVGMVAVVDHPSPAAPIELGGAHDVLRIRPFRRLWLVLGLSSLGDWLGLLGTAAFASAQFTAPAAQGMAFGSVMAVRLLPAVLLGPLAGIVADRFDRRYTMVATDLVRFALYGSIPVVGMALHQPAGAVGWAAVAVFLAEAAGMIWVPAKEASVPNLVPPDRLERANQLMLITGYGVTPVLAAMALAGTTWLNWIGPVKAIDFALYFDALTFLASASVVFFGVREISGRTATAHGMVRGIVDGMRYVATTPAVRGLVVGILGAFTGAGVAIGSAQFYALVLGGGSAMFDVLFAMLFVGTGVGVVAGPKVIGRLSRRRWFCVSIGLAGVAVIVDAVAPHIAVALVGTFVLGVAAGMALLVGITLLGAEVTDDVRGRVFAFVQAAVQVALLLAVSVSSVLAGVLPAVRLLTGPVPLDVPTVRILLAAAGIGLFATGLWALRQMDDRRGTPLLRDVWNSITQPRSASPQPGHGGDQQDKRDDGSLDATFYRGGAASRTARAARSRRTRTAAFRRQQRRPDATT